MAQDDNTVNIETEKERYHHGDLRAALIEEGLRQVGAATPDALSLREIARNVGVSATAVYRHFPDKAALIGALCHVGDERLAEAFREAMNTAQPGLEAFNAMGRAYVRFALAHPSLFRLMMSFPQQPGSMGAPSSQSRGMTMLVEALNNLAGAHGTSAENDIRRLKAWSLVHGLAMLMLDGQVPPDERVIERVVDAAML